MDFESTVLPLPVAPKSVIFKGLFFTIITFGIYSAWFAMDLRRYILSNIKVGNARFVYNGDGTEYFFHQSGCVGTSFDDLREGQRVSFTVGQGPKGPRAENVKPE